MRLDYDNQTPAEKLFVPRYQYQQDSTSRINFTKPILVEDEDSRAQFAYNYLLQLAAVYKINTRKVADE